MVTTVHGFSSEAILPVYRRLRRHRALRRRSATPTATRTWPTRRRSTTASTWPPFTFRAPSPGSTCCSSAASTRTRAPTWPIEVARRAGLPLVIAGIVQDEDYFRELVRPHLGRRASATSGPVGPAERDALLGGALALLHLIRFAEPFGLAVVEALATGTPVIAFPLGVDARDRRHGRTGFLVDDVDGAVAAVGRVGALAARHCRDDVEAPLHARRAWWRTTRSCSPASSAAARRRSAGRAAPAASTRANRTEASLAP